MRLDIHHKTSRTPNNIMFKIHFLPNIQLLHSLNIINRSTKSTIGQEEVPQSEDEEELQDLIRFLIKWLSLEFLKISSIEASRCIISNPIYTNSHMKDRCSWREIMAKHQLSTGPCNKEGIIIRISTKSNNLFHSRHGFIQFPYLILDTQRTTRPYFFFEAPYYKSTVKVHIF